MNATTVMLARLASVACTWIDAHRVLVRLVIFFAACAALGWTVEGYRLEHGFAPINPFIRGTP
jgi:hypothetical protein